MGPVTIIEVKLAWERCWSNRGKTCIGALLVLLGHAVVERIIKLRHLCLDGAVKFFVEEGAAADIGV